MAKKSEKWCIEVTEDNQKELNDWLHQNSKNYKGYDKETWFVSTGRFPYFFHSKSVIGHSMYRVQHEFRLITTEEFRAKYKHYTLEDFKNGLVAMSNKKSDRDLVKAVIKHTTGEDSTGWGNYYRIENSKFTCRIYDTNLPIRSVRKFAKQLPKTKIYTIADLSKGKVSLEYDKSNLEGLREVLRKAFPTDDWPINGTHYYYHTCGYDLNKWTRSKAPVEGIPTQKLSVFLQELNSSKPECPPVTEDTTNNTSRSEAKQPKIDCFIPQASLNELAALRDILKSINGCLSLPLIYNLKHTIGGVLRNGEILVYPNSKGKSFSAHITAIENLTKNLDFATPKVVIKEENPLSESLAQPSYVPFDKNTIKNSLGRGVKDSEGDTWLIRQAFEDEVVISNRAAVAVASYSNLLKYFTFTTDGSVVGRKI